MKKKFHSYVQSVKKAIVFYSHLLKVIKSFGLGAKLRYMGYFASLLHPQEEKTWSLF